jgi:hypothetical protein
MAWPRDSRSTPHPPSLARGAGSESIRSHPRFTRGSDKAIRGDRIDVTERAQSIADCVQPTSDRDPFITRHRMTITEPRMLINRDAKTSFRSDHDVACPVQTIPSPHHGLYALPHALPSPITSSTRSLTTFICPITNSKCSRTSLPSPIATFTSPIPSTTSSIPSSCPPPQALAPTPAHQNDRPRPFSPRVLTLENRCES